LIDQVLLGTGTVLGTFLVCQIPLSSGKNVYICL
jgi:hypothetical protein